jgi:hypothetical protein
MRRPLVECIPTCPAPGATPKYPTITVEAHLRETRQT